MLHLLSGCGINRILALDKLILAQGNIEKARNNPDICLNNQPTCTCTWTCTQPVWLGKSAYLIYQKQPNHLDQRFVVSPFPCQAVPLLLVTKCTTSILSAERSLKNTVYFLRVNVTLSSVPLRVLRRIILQRPTSWKLSLHRQELPGTILGAW